jgi:hypothetical protein
MPNDPLLQIFGEASNALQSTLNSATRDSTTTQDLEAIAITQGRLVTFSFASDGDQTVPHGLNRVPNGFFPVDITSTDHPRFRTTSKDDANIVINTTNSGISTVVIWVF